MPRFRTRQFLRPVNSRKHIVDIQGGLIADTQTLNSIIDTVDNPVLANPKDVRTGAKISSIFLNIQVYATGSGALSNVYMMIYKNAGNNIAAANIPDANAVGVSDFKKMVFHQEMTMTEKNTTAIPRTLFKGVLKIPRHMQRMGYDDIIIVALFSPGVTFDFCIQAIYKDYT